MLSCRSVPASESGDDSAAVVRDSVRGVLSVVGAEPLTALLLTPARGAAVAIEGSQAVVMRGLSRLEVTAMGRMTTRRSSSSPMSYVFEADTFVVRAADRVVAYDGIVVQAADGFYLVSGDSRVSVAYLPAALRDRLGARVFVVGPLDRAPIAYGTIVAASSASP
jgi:hypothetical protein